MTLLKRLSHLAAVAGLLFAWMALAVPAQAAQADVELLQSYVGSWRGSGNLTGGTEPEKFSCRMTITKGKEGKIHYAGRCSLAGLNLSVAGTIAYIDAAGRYEAVMTSNATFSGTAVGIRQGDGVVFNLRERDTNEQGTEMTITSRVVLRGGGITVDFDVLFNETGERMKAAVPFKR
jgi:hypothetical protein